MNTKQTRSSNDTSSAAEQAMKAADRVADRGVEYAEQAQEVAKEKLGEMERAIRENPMRAAAIAAGVGFLIAFLARR